MTSWCTRGGAIWRWTWSFWPAGAFVIAKAGKPLVKVTALEAPAAPQRLGFLVGEIAVPDDFDRMGEDAIEALFGSDA